MVTVNHNVVELNNAFHILDELAETSSRNEKMDLLKSGIDNECLKKILLYTYNTYWTYNIRKLPDISYIDDNPDSNPTSMLRYKVFFEMLDNLKSRKLTGNAALESVIEFLETCNYEESWWYISVLFKDLDVGITEKTINKVFGKGFVPVFECMLAIPFVEYPERFVVLFKLDGYRCLAFHDNDGNVTMISRNGKQYFGFDDVENEIKKLPRGYVYDGELMAKDKTFSGIQRQGTRKAKGKDANFNLFDCLPIEDFDNQDNNQNWFERRKHLYNSINENDLEHIILVKSFGLFESKDSDSDSRVDKIYNAALSLGYEGLIVVDVDSPYQFKKAKHWQKIKPYETFDLEVIGFNEGTGKNAGTLGAFVVDFDGVEVRVGSGIIDKADENKPNKYYRDYIWENRAKFINKTIEVRAGEVTDNMTGTPSLRFPRFLGFRFDK